MRKMSLLILLSAVLFVPSVSLAGDLVLPYKFKPATPAYASSINANFEALRGGVNDNTSKIDDQNNRLTVNSGNIESNAGSITKVKSDLAIHGHEPGDITPQGSDSGFDADLLDSRDSRDFADSVHTHGPADVAPQGSGSGLDADLLDGKDSKGFAEAIHGHWPSDIARQGSGSGLDADLLDSRDSKDFADSVHGHTPGDISPQGAGSGLDADMLDGVDSKGFAAAGHDHDARYPLIGHTHPSEEITGPVNADTLDSLDSADFARADHVHPDYALKAHDHDAYVKMMSDQEKRIGSLESYGDLSGVLDEIAELRSMVANLRSKIEELEKELEKRPSE